VGPVDLNTKQRNILKLRKFSSEVIEWNHILLVDRNTFLGSLAKYLPERKYLE
jgi:hypothetical protein